MKNYILSMCTIVALSLCLSTSAWANPAVGSLSDKQDKPKRVGTAAMISTSGHILTSAALVGRNDEMFFTLPSSDTSVPASVIAVDDDLGVALLRLDGTGGTTVAPLVFSKNVSAEARLVSSLSRVDGALSISEGAISNMLVKAADGARFLKHNATISAAGYGGVLANECGEIVGLNVVDPFLSVRRARQMPAPEDSIYAADISSILNFLDTRGVAVTRATQDCLSAAEKAAALEEEGEKKQAEFEKESEEKQAEFEKKSKEKQAELDRVQRDLDEKREKSLEAQKRADEAEQDARRKAAEVERLKKDKKASAEEREAAEEDADSARKAAESAAIEAANRAKEIANLKEEQNVLQLAIDAAKNRQKKMMIGGGVVFILLTLLAGLMIGRRSKALKVEQAAKAGVIQQLNATFPNIECRGQDQNNAPHAFIISGNSLLKSQQGLVIGRQPQSSDILINHPEISRAHLRASLRNGVIYVEDLGSTNGATLNGAPLSPNMPMPLKSGDVLTLGKITFQVRFLDA